MWVWPYGNANELLNLAHCEKLSLQPKQGKVQVIARSAGALYVVAECEDVGSARKWLAEARAKLNRARNA